MKFDYIFPYFYAYPENKDETYILQGFGFKHNPADSLYVHYDPKFLSPFQKEECSDNVYTAISNFKNSGNLCSDIYVPSPEGLSYFPYQLAGVEFMRDNEKCLLADEPGTGKTIQIAGLINLMKLKKVLILCPASLRLNWKKELYKWCGIDAVTDFDIDADVMIMSYDSLQFKGRFAKLRTIEWDLMVLDESHYCKTANAARTKNSLAIAQHAKRVVFMSGTPLVNRTLELFTMLNYLAPEYFGDETKFAIRYCGAHLRDIYFKGKDGQRRVKKIWDKSGASNLNELNTMLRCGIMLRRRKVDVLPQLPNKIRQIIEVNIEKALALEISELEGEVGKLSEEKLEELILGKDFQISDMAKLRKRVAEVKLESAIKHIKMLIFSIDKIVVFCHHRDIGDALMQSLSEYNPVILRGGMSDKEKQQSVDRFQGEASTRVFIGNIKASGVGITLTAASTIVFVELVPVPGEMTQAEDRCCRIGATAESIHIQHIVLTDSLDERICKMIVRKQKVSDVVLGDKSEKMF